jgi:hypothetical protein
MKNEFRKFPTSTVPRKASSAMPIVTEGARFGALIGVFALGSLVVHNDVNLQIGVKLTVQQGSPILGNG